ncbi:MAG: hypothetical protein R3Y04_09580 [Rikenellaceae bacterium]
MKREIITINSRGAVSIPNKVQMTAFEIAQLLGIYVPTVKTHIKAILKSEACRGDMSFGGTVVSGVIQPDYFGLDMVIAIAFRVQSYKADLFRRYVMSRILKPATQPMFITLNSENCEMLFN